MDLCYVYREMTHQRKAYNHTASGYAFIAKLTPDYIKGKLTITQHLDMHL